MKKSIVNILLVTFVGLAFAGCTWKLFPNRADLKNKKTVQPSQQEQEVVSNEEVVTELTDPNETDLTFVATEDGQTAFELLEENAQVDSEQYDFGVLIRSINGKASDKDHYWALYVNDEYAQTGADQTVLTNGDLTEWRYEEIIAQ